MSNTDSSEPKCAFCSKLHNEVERLIAGPNVYICDGCIQVCYGILEYELGPLKPKSLPVPKKNPDLKRLESEVELLLRMRAKNEITEAVFRERMAQATVDAFVPEDLDESKAAS